MAKKTRVTVLEYGRSGKVLDSEMKRLRGQGLGAKKHQAKPISHEEEELLWGK